MNEILNKKALSEIVAEKLKVTKKDAAAAVEAVCETVTAELAKGNKVDISGFGKFEVKERAARQGINPATKETIQIPASKVPAFKAAKALKEAGNKVYMIAGARTKDLLFWEDKMKEACTELYLTTDDGSYGIKGFGTTVLQEIIDREKVDYVIAVGPMPMMRAVAELTRDKGIYTEASMNPIMVDGTGMCGACRVTVGGETKFACVDGPDFDAHKIDFDEVINRTRIYKDQERKRSENCNLLKQAQ